MWPEHQPKAGWRLIRDGARLPTGEEGARVARLTQGAAAAARRPREGPAVGAARAWGSPRTHAGAASSPVAAAPPPPDAQPAVAPGLGPSSRAPGPLPWGTRRPDPPASRADFTEHVASRRARPVRGSALRDAEGRRLCSERGTAAAARTGALCSRPARAVCPPHGRDAEPPRLSPASKSLPPHQEDEAEMSSRD